MSEAALNRHWDTLGLPPNSSLEDLEIRYCLLIEHIPENPTEDQERQWQEIRTAYSVLRHASVPKEKKGLAWVSPVLLVRAGLVAAAGVLLGALLLLAFNYKSLAVRWTEVEAGAELRIKSTNQPYGTVLEFDRNHAFPAGSPGPAYKVRLAGSGEEIWVGERLVELGMTH